MARRRYTSFELSEEPEAAIVNYYVCDTENDKPDPAQGNVGDQAFVRSTKKLYIADGDWIPFG